MNREKFKGAQLVRRARRVRRRVRGTAERPRLSVYRSLMNVYCQIIDDDRGATLVAASTRDPRVREQAAYGGNCAAAKALGAVVAGRAKEAGIERVVFDRGGRRYHGRLKALAEAARKAGLSF